MELSSRDRAGLAGTLVEFLHEMHHYDGGRMLPLVHKAGITLPQMAVLEYVRKARTVSAIAGYSGLSRPATSAMVDKLVRRGYVRRSEGAADRRVRAVGLTAKGEVLLERIRAAREARFEATLAALPAAAVRRLGRVLNDVTASLARARERSEEGQPA